MYDLIHDWVHNADELHEFIRTHHIDTESHFFYEQLLEIAVRKDSPELISEYLSFGGHLGRAICDAISHDSIQIIWRWMDHTVINSGIWMDDVGPRTGPFVTEYMRRRDKHFHQLFLAKTTKMVLRSGKPAPYADTGPFTVYHEFASAVACHSPLNEELFLRYWGRADCDHHALIQQMIADQKRYDKRHPENILRAVELIGSQPERFETLFLESGWPELIGSTDLTRRGGDNKTRLFLHACRGGHVPTIERLWPRSSKAAREGILELINRGTVEPLRGRMGWRHELGYGPNRTTYLSRNLIASEPGARKSVVELDLLEYLGNKNLNDLRRYGSRDGDDTLLEYIGRPATESASREGGWYLLRE